MQLLASIDLDNIKDPTRYVRYSQFDLRPTIDHSDLLKRKSSVVEEMCASELNKRYRKKHANNTQNHTHRTTESQSKMMMIQSNPTPIRPTMRFPVLSANEFTREIVIETK